MSLLIGAATLGLILSLLALGVVISFRVFAFPDITAEGSITLGAALAAALIVHDVHPFWATAAGCVAGFVAGTITGTLATKFNINGLLSGILVMTALYSINLHIMGRSNVPLMGHQTLASAAEHVGTSAAGGEQSMMLFGWDVAVLDISLLLGSLLVVATVGVLLFIFFQTNLGSAMRATGDNAQMIRALGVSDENMIIFGLGISNALIAVSGALLAQYQGFADVQMGIGMVVWGLASVIIGEALVGTPRSLGLAITGAVMGSIFFRLLVAIALRVGLDPNDLKLVTAVFVFAALIFPDLLKRIRKARPAHA